MVSPPRGTWCPLRERCCVFLQIVDRILPFLRRGKKEGKVCPNGHVMHPSWDVCPYCLEMQQMMAMQQAGGGGGGGGMPMPMPSAGQGTAMVNLSDLSKGAKDARQGAGCGRLAGVNRPH